MDGFFSFNTGPFFEDAIKADRYLFEMAAYDITGGLIPTNISPENISDLQERTAKRFNYFKKQIKSGETTIDELSKFIAIKNGAFKQKKMTEDEAFESIVKGGRKPIIEVAPQGDQASLLKKIFSEIASKNLSITTGDKLFPQVDSGEKKEDSIKPKKNKKNKAK